MRREGGYIGLLDVAGADFDGDGRRDLVTSSFEFGSRDRVAWWRNVGFRIRRTADERVSALIRLFLLADSGGFAALEGQRRLELTATWTARRGDRTLGAGTVEMTSIGTSAGRAVKRALVGRGRNLIRRLLEETAPLLAEQAR